MDGENQPSYDSHNVVFGVNVTLWCTEGVGDTVEWYINGQEVKNGIQSGSKLRLKFTIQGVYQCKVSSNESSSVLKTVTLCGVGEYIIIIIR